MDIFEKLLRKGSPFLVLFFAALTLFFVVYAALEPEHRYASLFLVVIASSGTWRQYVVWSRKRAQRGKELLGTDPRER